MTTNPTSTAWKPPATPPAWVNRLVIGLLRSPLHRVVSGKILLLSFTGRRSGRSYTIPVSYVQDGSVVLCSTDREARIWWRNLRGGVPVTVQLQGREVQGRADVIEDDPEAIVRGIRRMLAVVPGDSRYYGVRLDGQGQPVTEDLVQAAQRRVLIQVTLDEG